MPVAAGVGGRADAGIGARKLCPAEWQPPAARGPEVQAVPPGRGHRGRRREARQDQWRELERFAALAKSVLSESAPPALRPLAE